MDYPDSIEFPVLFKIVEKQYKEDLLQGKLYMNTLQYFVDLEKNTGKQGVGDVREASLINIKKHKLFLQIDGGERQEIEIGPPPGIIYDQVALMHPVFCMVGKKYVQIRNANNVYECIIYLDRELLDVFTNGNDADYCVVMIYNTIDFLQRVENTINSIGETVKVGPITYRDMSLPRIENGGIVLDDTFTKDIKFRIQSEYRIELFKQCTEPYVLNVGDIRDIAYEMEISQIEKGLLIQQTILDDEEDVQC